MTVQHHQLLPPAQAHPPHAATAAAAPASAAGCPGWARRSWGCSWRWMCSCPPPFQASRGQLSTLTQVGCCMLFKRAGDASPPAHPPAHSNPAHPCTACPLRLPAPSACPPACLPACLQRVPSCSNAAARWQTPSRPTCTGWLHARATQPSRQPRRRCPGSSCWLTFTTSGYGTTWSRWVGGWASQPASQRPAASGQRAAAPSGQAAGCPRPPPGCLAGWHRHHAVGHGGAGRPGHCQ